MDSKIFNDSAQAVLFCEKLISDNNMFNIEETSDKLYKVTWVECKKYTAVDGKEYNDEVWMKEDGTMILCQDLELPHAKNIIRRMLRNYRHALQRVAIAIDSPNNDGFASQLPRMLH